MAEMTDSNYSRESYKRPPKMPRFSARLPEMVAYENLIKGSGVSFSCVRNTSFYILLENSLHAISN